MMKMVVNTSNNEKYEMDIVSVNFYKGKLIVIDVDGNTMTYSQDSLEYAGDGTGVITII